jgi:NTP pyrophosphatase (non-canonical NTP hydrolase)
MLSKELGDVLWYVAVLSERLGLKMEDVAKGNIQKLEDRNKRGKIRGKGDNR